MADSQFDLIVIGGGPGGYVGAIRASQLGMKVACVERDRLGGVCLNWGCIPTKALLKSAYLYQEVARHGKEWGFEYERLTHNWEKVIGRSRGVADTLNKGIHYLFKKNNIMHFEGHAKITRSAKATLPCEVQVFDKPGGTKQHTITAPKVLVATGAAPRELPFAPFDGKTVIGSKEAMTMAVQPKRMLIVGAGAIGVEFAYFYNAFGTEVTIVEMLDRLLPIEDDDVSKVLEREFKKSGINIRTSHITKKIEKTRSGLAVTIAATGDESKTETIETDVVLVAIGVRGRYDGLFDAALGIETFKDHIKVAYKDVEDPTYQTSAPGIYAIGDVIGPPWLAHVASEEAVACVERMNGHDCVGVDYDSIPGCTYCHPQVASIGKTERALKEEGLVAGKDYNVGNYGLKAHGKAIAEGENVGMVKLLTSIPHGEILGAHLIGAEATELIAEFALARSVEATAEDIINTVHAHPTMNEAIHEAALASEGRMIHG
ncbi:MAG: dihydrolipoyl dehydrogenase [Phycisphaerales bacterium]|nr:dihydrolipoyl dehydrogenase [Phycisphaerales bacterium]